MTTHRVRDWVRKHTPDIGFGETPDPTPRRRVDSEMATNVLLAIAVLLVLVLLFGEVVS